MNICGGAGSDYIITPRKISDDIKQFKSIIDLLRETANQNVNFFYFYLINTLADYNIIKIIDIFTLDDKYIIQYYIRQIISYYETYLTNNADMHRIRIMKEFNINSELRQSLFTLLVKLDESHSVNNLSLVEIKNKIVKNINVNSNTNTIKRGSGITKSTFDVKLKDSINLQQNDKLSDCGLLSNHNQFQYLNDLLDYIIKINEQYYEYFDKYYLTNQKNINEIYNIVKQID
jgi:hypothetical protein